MTVTQIVSRIRSLFAERTANVQALSGWKQPVPRARGA